jgi:hypothetical protein
MEAGKCDAVWARGFLVGGAMDGDVDFARGEGSPGEFWMGAGF